MEHEFLRSAAGLYTLGNGPVVLRDAATDNRKRDQKLESQRSLRQAAEIAEQLGCGTEPLPLRSAIKGRTVAFPDCVTGYRDYLPPFGKLINLPSKVAGSKLRGRAGLKSPA